MGKLFQNFLVKYEHRRLASIPFVIVSNNCWGFQVYQLLGRFYNTPFVGVFIYPKCYLKLIENFPGIQAERLLFSNHSRYFEAKAKYPIGILFQDVEIHFLHETDESVAANKWHRRVDRMMVSIKNGEKVCAKFCDRDGAVAEDLIMFHCLGRERGWNVISFGINEIDVLGHCVVPKLLSEGGGK